MFRNCPEITMHTANYNVTAVRPTGNHMLLIHDGRYVAALARSDTDEDFFDTFKEGMLEFGYQQGGPSKLHSIKDKGKLVYQC